MSNSSKLERLWSPWRMEYVGSDKKSEQEEEYDFLEGAEEDCFLCQYSAASGDCGKMVVRRTDEILVCLNRHPYNNGHLLVAPRHHLARLDEIPHRTLVEMTGAIVEYTNKLEKLIKAQGFNVGLNLGAAAGAGVPGHLHWHIVPRWQGDINFTTTIAGTRVIPQSLEALWEILVATSTGSDF